MTVYIDQIGSGPELVLLHGWGLHSGLWAPVIDDLSRSFTVTQIDLPGHGYSDKPRVLTVESMARAIGDALDTRTNGPATVVGWSMGAFVAFALVREFPQRFDRLVWIAGTPSFVQRPGWAVGMDPHILDGFARGLKRDYRATLQRFISLNGGKGMDRPLLKSMQQRAFERGDVNPDILDQGLTILRDSDVRQELADSRMPMLLLQGSHDRLVHPDTVGAVAELRPVERQMIKGAGHAPFFNEPEVVARSLREFCQ